MKLTLAAVAAVAVCLYSLAARSRAIRAAARTQQAYLEQEQLALAAIDGHLRARLPRLTNR